MSTGDLGSRILVVGGGFIGAALAESLTKRYYVKVIDKIERNTPEAVGFVACDVRDYSALRREATGMDLVIHTAIVQIPQINDEKRSAYEVNVKGTQNVCEAVREIPSIKGMILAGSWHAIDVRHLNRVVDESSGFRLDMFEERARIYAFSKITQESIVRLFGEETQSKTFGIIRMGTVLGMSMPRMTAAYRFIEQALNGKAISLYDHAMHRPMLYISINDVCRSFEIFGRKIVHGQLRRIPNNLATVNLFYPRPMTVLELAMIVRNTVIKLTRGRIRPEVKIVKTGQRKLFNGDDKRSIRVDVSKARTFLGMRELTDPRHVILQIVKSKLEQD